MSVQLKPISVIKMNLGIQRGGPVHKFFTDTCYKAMDKYVPMDNGDLRSNVSFGINGTYIEYEMPYASYQYRGMREDGTHKINPDNYTTPGTGPYWDKRMISADAEKILKQVQDYVNKRGGK